MKNLVKNCKVVTIINNFYYNNTNDKELNTTQTNEVLVKNKDLDDDSDDDSDDESNDSDDAVDGSVDGSIDDTVDGSIDDKDEYNINLEKLKLIDKDK